MIRLLAVIGVLTLLVPANADDLRRVGVASIDITPDYPIRLSGYGGRKTESDGVETKLYAKALALEGDGGPAVLMTVDNVGVCANVVGEVLQRLAKANVSRERFAVCSSHTHTGPQLVGSCPNMFQGLETAEQTATIEKYTRELIDKMEMVALAAIGDMKPGKISHTTGTVTFAANRRPQDGPGGPVDHDVPLLRVTDADGKLRAVVANYACHCTTMSGNDNKICGDWAGFASEQIEKNHPGAVALITIGCGADSDPQPRTGLKFAKQNGDTLAAEIERLLTTDLKPIGAPLKAQFKLIHLPFDTLPTREKWAELAKQDGPVGYNAKVHLAKLDRGEKIATELPYPVQTWVFGDDFAMTFLAGEVVVDYALRLKKEFDPARLWVTAYANDVPCYIPSRRILQEGGYEAEGAMLWYAKPGRLAPSVENQIMRTLHELLPLSLRTPESKAAFPPPKSLEDALKTFKLRDDLAIELVASEPLVFDPVHIDFAADGKLWVADMLDYPNGKYDNGEPGGQIKFLEDTNGDGKYDKSTVFLDDLPYPTGVMPWRKGVLVCAAPDIIYAEDTNGDGRADVKKVLFSGFSPENQQWEVNSLSWGLDNWVYGASSARNDPIKVIDGKDTIDLGARDFRMNPDTLAFEPAAGRSQYGRTRDDFDNWFGCDNSTLMWHYPLPEQYVRRNPHVAPPAASVRLPKYENHDLLYPISRTLERFNDFNSANRVTSGCGLGFYRDDMLGEEFYGNAFVAEPVHNLVHRLVMKPDGNTFDPRRSEDNAESEFLSSTDNWFRPAQVRTGPDGALWVVDMYRFVIEHPRWIPADKLAQLDTRAGDDKGRIYRIVRKGTAPRAMRDFSKVSSIELAVMIDSHNGTLRDIAHRELVHRGDRKAAAALEKIAQKSKWPAARVQALCALDGIGALPRPPLEVAMEDEHPAVRRHGVRLVEKLNDDPPLKQVLSKANDPDATVRFQVALTLGNLDSVSPKILAGLAIAARDDTWLRAAVLSSSVKHAPEMSLTIIEEQDDPPANVVDPLIATTAAAHGAALPDIINAIASRQGDVKPWQFSALAAALDALDRRDEKLSVESASKIFEAARKAAPKSSAAIRLLGRGPDRQDEDLKLLASFLNPKVPFDKQAVALATMARSRSDSVGKLLLANWPGYSPQLRATVLDTLMSRIEWMNLLLDSTEAQVPSAEIDAAHREMLLKHEVADVRTRAAKRLASVRPAARTAVIEQFRPCLQLKGDAKAGCATFTKLCASCHKVGDIGHDVGPNLLALSDRGSGALLTAILDPNAAVETKFTAYVVETADGRALSGIVTGENATGLTILQGNGVRDTVLRGDIRKMRSARMSLMPEGLEQGVSAQQMADLIAFVQSDGSPAKASSAAELAAIALDDARPANQREAAISDNPKLSAELIAAMTADLKPKTPEEYRRIPWIWRVAVAAGKRNDADEIKRILEVSTPKLDQPLHDWQAVVIGGGIINGLSLKDIWPKERIDEILAGDAELAKRYDRALDLSSAMADDEKVPNGTRYDALRMIAMQGFDKRGEQLVKYLAKGVDNELQQGAVSGLVDVRAPDTAAAVLSGWDHYSAGNRNFALDGLLRDPARIPALKEAVSAGKITREQLGDERAKRLDAR